MTLAMYWEDAYCRAAEAEVVGARTTDNGMQIAFNRTIFYPRGGGQPGDCGEVCINNLRIIVADAIKDRESGIIWHCVAGDSQPKIATGMRANLILDWTRRHRMMRAHTAMHLLCAAVNAPVTGGGMDELRGRIDFDSEAPFDREEIARKMNEWIAADLPVSIRWADEKELDDNPALIRTMSVSPPRGAGKVRLVQIGDVDLQACGGTHVASLGEIGAASIVKIEKKGRINRRAAFQLA